jgi:L-lysine exporter family protein LysE/ArgO
LTAAVSGFLLGFSLILAIGAQNAFVLRQGLRDEHVLTVVLACALSDALLIAVGVAGMGSLTAENPTLRHLLTWGGAAFLIVYGAIRFLAAWRGGATLTPGEAAPSRAAALTTCLALTWLNPHVWLDTVVLIGSVSSRFADQRWEFGVGAVIASFVFFFGLGYGARLLRPFFATPSAWRALDVVVGATMWMLATVLLAEA